MDSFGRGFRVEGVKENQTRVQVVTRANLERLLSRTCVIDFYYVVLESPDLHGAPGDFLDHAGPKIVADEEALPFADASLDLVVSALALQSVNDLPGTLVQVRRSLKPDGYFLAALIGGDTLGELRQSFAAAEAEIYAAASRRSR